MGADHFDTGYMVLPASRDVRERQIATAERLEVAAI
jgi:hypothetical protein